MKMPETILDVKDLYVGRVDATKYGYKRGTLKVTVNAKITREAGSEETIEHDAITDPLYFAMSAAVWNQRQTDHTSGGQIVEVLNDLTVFADGFDAAKASQLAELWQRWHLNMMRAGCAHIEPVYKTGQYNRREVDMARTPECPVNRGSEAEPDHYRWGHAWLMEPLPEGFEATLRALLPRSGQDGSDEDTMSLKAMMARDGIKMSATRAAHRLDEANPDGTRWRVSFRRPGAVSAFGVTYGLGSAYGDRKPAGPEVLSNVLDNAQTFRNARSADGLAGAFGIEQDKAEKLYRKLEKQEAGLRSFLGDKYDEYAALD